MSLYTTEQFIQGTLTHSDTIRCTLTSSRRCRGWQWMKEGKKKVLSCGLIVQEIVRGFLLRSIDVKERDGERGMMQVALSLFPSLPVPERRASTCLIPTIPRFCSCCSTDLIESPLWTLHI